MGTSNWQNLSYCVELIRKEAPSSVLDIGVGFGRWSQRLDGGGAEPVSDRLQAHVQGLYPA